MNATSGKQLHFNDPLNDDVEDVLDDSPVKTEWVTFSDQGMTVSQVAKERFDIVDHEETKEMVEEKQFERATDEPWDHKMGDMRYDLANSVGKAYQDLNEQRWK